MVETPTPDEIITARNSLGMTQTQAADLIFTQSRTWQRYEAGDRTMHPAFWYLFRLRTGILIDDAQ